jgi:hypothetical protein
LQQILLLPLHLVYVLKGVLLPDHFFRDFDLRLQGAHRLEVRQLQGLLKLRPVRLNLETVPRSVVQEFAVYKLATGEGAPNLRTLSEYLG